MRLGANLTTGELLAPSCSTCRHLIGAIACDAFPGGIPSAILGGDVPHLEPVDGDGGVVWAPAWPSGSTAPAQFSGDPAPPASPPPSPLRSAP